MPGQTFVTVMPLLDVVDAARRSWQMGATLFVAFGVLALLVAASASPAARAAQADPNAALRAE